MKISELKTNQGNVEVEGTIKEIGEIRTFNKFGRELRVANAILSDDSGSVKLTLWNDDATRFSQGDKIKISNGYVGEFQGEKQLSSGKFGKIEKLGSGPKSKDDTDEIIEELGEVEEESGDY
ncbi:MAG: SOSS complex subunit B family protein [Candidatus Pacearchaeota archaeon]